MEQQVSGQDWRARLRRVMPRVAIAAGVCFVLRSFLRDTLLYRNGFVSALFDLITFCLVAATLGYYGGRTLLWLKRRLFWRVRRRLVITYLFIGLTPIILLTTLGLIFTVGVSISGLSRTVTAQVEQTNRQALANARTLADAFARLPAGMDVHHTQMWLDEQTALLQASSPGVRVSVWQSAGELDLAQLGEHAPAAFTSEPATEETRGVGGNQVSAAAPLPAWLRGRNEWSGFTFVPPADAGEVYGTPAVRALVRREASGRAFALLLTVPVNRALMRQLGESTGIELHPFFIGSEAVEINADDKGIRVRSNGDTPSSPNFGQRTDQLGDPLPRSFTWVVLATTDWRDGAESPHIAFLMQQTQAQLFKQVLGSGGYFDVVWRNILLAVAIVFLVLELLALFAAGWMTRAVTGTVHKLYRATEYIKRGDFSHRVHIRSQDQLGELAGAYNDMAANIEALLEERVERERLEREIEIAAEVQAQLFPRAVPKLASVEIAAECRAARGVAGDYYDYVEIAPGFIALALGDVSGKGLSASLVMSNLQASLRAQTTILAERLRLAARAAVANVAGQASEAAAPCGVTGVDNACAVEEMVANINTQLEQSTDANRFVTLFLALYDDHTRRLRYTNAGHNAPFLIRADGTHERLDTGGTVVGAFDFARYEESAVTLAPGDLLLIFSDGISEAQDGVGAEYGESRLLQFVRQHCTRPADELRRAIFDEIEHWSGGRERGDDQTVVILKARG
jgi:phosphoserine phosphatase RsbU/P